MMVDLLLDMQGITVDQGLVYLLDEGLESYPVSGVERQLYVLYRADVTSFLFSFFSWSSLSMSC